MQRVLGKDGRDLRVRHGDAAGAKTGRDRRRIGRGHADHRDEDLDDARQIQRRRGLRLNRRGGRRHLRHAAASLQLRRRAVGVGMHVDVDGRDALAPQGPSRDEAAQRIVDPQPQERLQLLVRVTGGGLADQHNHGGPQGPVPREAHLAVEPQAVRIERRDLPQRVVGPRVAVAAQVAEPIQDPKHRPGRRAERSLERLELHHESAPEEPLGSLGARVRLPSRCHNHD